MNRASTDGAALGHSLASTMPIAPLPEVEKLYRLSNLEAAPRSFRSTCSVLHADQLVRWNRRWTERQDFHGQLLRLISVGNETVGQVMDAVREAIPGMRRQAISRVLGKLTARGFVVPNGAGRFQVHPRLRGCLPA